MGVDIRIDESRIEIADHFPTRQRAWTLLACCVAAATFTSVLHYVGPMLDFWFETLVWAGLSLSFAGLFGLSDPDRHVLFWTDKQQVTVTLTWPLLRKPRSGVIAFAAIRSIGIEEVSDGLGYGGTYPWVVVRTFGAKDGAANQFFAEWRINSQGPVALWRAGDHDRTLGAVLKMTGLNFERQSR